MSSYRTFAVLGLVLLLLFGCIGPPTPTPTPTPTPGPVPNATNGTVSTKLTRDDAAALLIKDVIEKLPDKEMVTAYGYADMLVKGDNYSVIDGNETLMAAGSDGWLFWVDMAPFARFSHPVNVVFIEADGGAMTQSDAGFWPRVRGEMQEPEIYINLSNLTVYYGADINATLTPDDMMRIFGIDPAFGACTASQDARKKAIVVWAMAQDSDGPIKQDAVNMYHALCANGYYTKALTADDASALKALITSEVRSIAEKSREPNKDLNSFVFYTVTHGQRNTGNLVVNLRGGRNEVLPIAEVAEVLGAEAYAIGVGGMWSDSFAVIQDSCYSGNALDAYPPRAHIPGNREGAVGWVFSSQNRTQMGYGDPNRNQTSTFTNAVVGCMAPLITADKLSACVQPGIDTALAPWAASGYKQTSLYTKLTPPTDAVVPVFSQ